MKTLYYYIIGFISLFTVKFAKSGGKGSGSGWYIFGVFTQIARKIL